MVDTKYKITFVNALVNKFTPADILTPNIHNVILSLPKGNLKIYTSLGTVFLLYNLGLDNTISECSHCDISARVFQCTAYNRKASRMTHIKMYQE